MATPAQEPSPAPTPNDAVTKITPVVDLVSKMVAGVAIALYVCGFLIVSIYQFGYGFSEINPFRPRILAAGAWFLLFAAVPISYVRNYTGGHHLSWTRIVQLLPAYFGGCAILSWSLFIAFTFVDIPAHSSKTWTWIILGSVLYIPLILLTELKKVSSRVSIVASSALICLQIASAIIDCIFHGFQISAITLWFFIISILTILILKHRTTESLFRWWFDNIFLLLPALFVFGSLYYPHIRTSWGGGTPMPVTIYFSKDSPMNPGQKLSVQLIDETDSGFYVVGPGEDKAIYIPRNLVSLVYFSDKTSRSKLLP